MRRLEDGVRCRLRCGLETEEFERNRPNSGPEFCWKAFVPGLGRQEFWCRDGFYQLEGLDDLDIVEILP